MSDIVDSLSKLEVVVVGAGPSGLTAATALSRQGHRVTVLERQPALQSPGGPLTIQASASKCLYHLGAKKILEENSLEMDSMAWWSFEEDQPMAVVPFPVISRTPRHRVNRQLIQKIMYDVAVESGVSVMFGKNVVRLSETAQSTQLWAQDGEQWKADLIVGADGIKSNIRRLIFPSKNVESIPTEECIFLTQVPTAILESDPRVSNLLRPRSFQITMGPGRFHNTSLHRSGSYAMTITVMGYGEPSAVDGTWNKPANVEELRAHFQDFNEPTRAYLEHVQTAEMWHVAYSRHLESWRSEGGRVVLIGDAAHAMLPHRAMGLSQGIEDAAALGHFMKWAPTRGVSFATDSFEKLRRPRVEKIVQASIANAHRNALPSGPEQLQRDLAIRRSNGTSRNVDWDKILPDSEAPPRSPEYEKWENDYDVIAEVEKYIADLQYKDM